jgi:hypothetical protein
MKKVCIKKRYWTREEAILAGAKIRRSQFNASGFQAYRCTVCKYSNGKRAWHWGGLHYFTPRKR